MRTCKHGHPRTPENTRTKPSGARECAVCHRVQNKRYREANKTKVRERQLKWERNQPIEYGRERRRRLNQDDRRRWSREWSKRNPKSIRAACCRRRARKVSQLGSFPIPEPEFIGLLWETDPHCYYCRAPLRALYHVEHKIPLSRPEMKPAHWEGLHDFRNIRLACAGCNLSKGRKTANEFMEAQWQH